MNDWIPLELPYNSFGKGDSFVGRELNVPGTLIRVNGEEFLIGHVNDERGTCDCCPQFFSEAIVEAYRVVWRPDTF